MDLNTFLLKRIQAQPRVADPGCLTWIPDPNFFHPGTRIHIKEFRYLNLKKYDPGVHPGLGS
jgi:hypothetical protein